MRIQVTPSEVRALAAQFVQASRSLDDVRLQIQRAWGSLDWQVRHEIALEASVIQAQRQVLAMMDEAAQMGRFLNERSDAFEQADNEESAHLAQTSGAWIASIGGIEALHSDRAASFSAARTQGYLRLGGWLGGSENSLASLRPVHVQPQEQRALFNFALDEIVSKAGPLGLLKDGWDVLHIPAWQAQVQQASVMWSNARVHYGATAPQTQAAYGNYLETMIFKMPFFGTKAEAFISLLNILGRMNPVE